jgi:glycine oxidase
MVCFISFVYNQIYNDPRINDKLRFEMNPEVLIIGGGVIGLSIARELHLRGLRRITLLEKGQCGEESSWAAAGMLGPQVEADVKDMFFDLCSKSRDLYPDLAPSLLEETGVDVELDRKGTLYLAFTEEDANELSRRYEWQRDAALAVAHLSTSEIINAEPLVSPAVQMGLFFQNDWQVENRKLLTALRRYAELNGIEIVENTRAERLLTDSGRVTGAETDRRTFTADQTVLATGAWSSLIKIGDAPPPFQIMPVRGQMICLQPKMPLFKHVIYSRRGYIVPRRDGRVLAGSTSEKTGFEKSVTDEASAFLQTMAGEISPLLGGLPIIDHWSGLRPFAADGMPILGVIDGIDDLFIATAHYRNGILLAPITAKLISERMVDGLRSEYLERFSVERLNIKRVNAIG